MFIAGADKEKTQGNDDVCHQSLQAGAEPHGASYFGLGYFRGMQFSGIVLRVGS
jgi:hypothetical protein